MFELSGASAGAPPPFKGALDLSRLAVAGHSCGGAAAALVAATRPEFAAAVALDPWWPILPAGGPALTGWLPGCRAPLAVIGSDAWNTPRGGPGGPLACDGARQAAVLEAARARGDGNGGAGDSGGSSGGGGGGALLIVPAHTQHHSFSDVPAILEASALARRALAAVGFSRPAASGAETLRLTAELTARFLRERFGGGPWPADASAPAADAGAPAGGDGNNGGDGSGSDNGGGGDSAEPDAATDEVEEAALEARVGFHPSAPPQQPHTALTSSTPAATAAAADAAAAPAPAPLPAAAHVRVRAAEAAAYRALAADGRLKVLRVFE